MAQRPVLKAPRTERQRAVQALAGVAAAPPVPSGGLGRGFAFLRSRNEQLAARLDLAADDAEVTRHDWLAEPSVAELAYATQLHAEAEDRAARANKDSREKARFTALGAYETFRACLPNRRFYRVPSGPGDAAVHAYNAASERLFAVHIRLSRGVRSKTISKYVSQIRTLMEEQLDRKLSSRDVGFKLARVYQQMRREDGPSGERLLSRPLRVQHFDRLAEPGSGYDCGETRWGIFRWAMWHVMLQCMLRGGEAGLVDRNQEPEPLLVLNCKAGPGSDPTNAWQWISAAENDGVYPLLVVRVMSIKDARGHADEAHVRRRPIIIRRRCPVGEPDHPLCPYDAMARAWRAMCEEVPVAARAATCFFRTDHGAPVTTDDVRIGVREVVSTLRLGPPHEWGAKAPRIGGATDLLGALGLEKAQRLLKSRGRWCNEKRADLRAPADRRAGRRLGGNAARDRPPPPTSTLRFSFFFDPALLPWPTMGMRAPARLARGAMRGERARTRHNSRLSKHSQPMTRDAAARCFALRAARTPLRCFSRHSIFAVVPSERGCRGRVLRPSLSRSYLGLFQPSQSPSSPGAADHDAFPLLTSCPSPKGGE